MPTKRTRRPRYNLEALTIDQRSELSCGVSFFGEEPWRDEEHRRRAWQRNREEIPSEWDRPGRRPVAMWQYDYGLERRPWPREWSWPRPILSEAEMVYRMLERGELEGCRLNGSVRIACELRQIETDWMHEIRVSLGSGRGVRQITAPLPTYGTPPWFYREHAPVIAARLAAEHRAYHQRSRTDDGLLRKT